MNKNEKTKTKILSGKGVNNISFWDVVNLLLSMGFSHTIRKDSHHHFRRKDLPIIINLQPDKKNKGKAKGYQIRQLKKYIEENNL